MKMNKFQKKVLETDLGQTGLKFCKVALQPDLRDAITNISRDLTAAAIACEALGITLDYCAEVALELCKARPEFEVTDPNDLPTEVN